jgi:hypothetical protein
MIFRSVIVIVLFNFLIFRLHLHVLHAFIFFNFLRNNQTLKLPCLLGLSILLNPGAGVVWGSPKVVDETIFHAILVAHYLVLITKLINSIHTLLEMSLYLEILITIISHPIILLISPIIVICIILKYFVIPPRYLFILGFRTT